ncbi:MAG: hypothetical protein LBH52_01995 [Puniceicoccales bacterium]|jgi:hypothetical protein|nr:hypothetical protein [Puniceicoccales bacterium]
MKSYYYIIVGVFCLCLENQTLFGTKVKIPDSIMGILQNKSYKDQCAQITRQHQAEIREGYKAHLCKTYNIENLTDDELSEWIREDLREDIKIGPEYYVLTHIRQYHKKNSNWAKKSKDDFFSSNGKCCSDNSVRFEDFKSPAGETNIYWALYQAGLIFMKTDPTFAMFCFKHLLILSNGQIPAFLFAPDPDPESNAVRRLQAGLRILSNLLWDQNKENARLLDKAIYSIVQYR